MISPVKSMFQPNSRSRHRGSALVEFALVSGMFLVLLLGIVQYGLYINASTSVVNIAREGARYSAVTTILPNSTDQIQVHDHITAKNILPPQLIPGAIPLNNVTVSYFEPNGINGSTRKIGNMVQVMVQYDMTSKFFLPKPVLGILLKNPYTAVSSFRIEQQ